MAVNLIERRKKIGQAKARLDLEEAAAGISERKKRTSRLIALGAKIEKHALAGFDDETLEGALAEQDAAAKDPKVLQRWKKAGTEKLARSSAVHVIVITFSGPVFPETIAALKENRFRLNRLRGEWEGRADLATATELAEPSGGKVQILGQVEGPTMGEERLAAE